MSDNTNTQTGKAKKRPDYLAYAVISQGGAAGPRYIRIGVGFIYKKGAVGVNYDATVLNGHLILVGIDDELPTTISYGHPTRKQDFDACMVREAGPDKSFWTNVGTAYRQEGYISILLDVVPDKKLVLSVPKDNR
jgi:hypothetical protein